MACFVMALVLAILDHSPISFNPHGNLMKQALGFLFFS